MKHLVVVAGSKCMFPKCEMEVPVFLVYCMPHLETISDMIQELIPEDEVLKKEVTT